MLAFAATTTTTTLLILAILSNVGHALPYSIERRVVGTLTCQEVASGHLNLYDSKTKATYGVTFANDYRLNDALNGAQRPSSVQGYGNPRILSSYPKAKAEEFQFWACTESARPGFEDFSPNANGSYYGHISSTKKPSYCLNHLNVYADQAYLVSEKCNYSDDSGSVSSYFTYTKSENGLIQFLGYTGPHGGLPNANAGSVYDFTPGTSSKSPAVNVHDGSPQFSDWVLQLK